MSLQKFMLFPVTLHVQSISVFCPSVGMKTNKKNVITDSGIKKSVLRPLQVLYFSTWSNSCLVSGWADRFIEVFFR